MFMKNFTQNRRITLLIFFIIGSACFLKGQKKCFDPKDYEQTDLPIEYLNKAVKCFDEGDFKDPSAKVLELTPVIKAYAALNSPRVKKCKDLLIRKLNKKLKDANDKMDRIRIQDEAIDKAEKNVEKFIQDFELSESITSTAFDELQKAQKNLDLLIKSAKDEDQIQQQAIEDAKVEVGNLDTVFKDRKTISDATQKNLNVAQGELNALSSSAIESDKNGLTSEISELERLLLVVDKI